MLNYQRIYRGTDWQQFCFSRSSYDNGFAFTIWIKHWTFYVGHRLWISHPSGSLKKTGWTTAQSMSQFFTSPEMFFGSVLLLVLWETPPSSLAVATCHHSLQSWVTPAGPHASYACWSLASCSATIPRSSNVSLQYPSQSSNTYSCGSKNIDGPVLTLKSINHGWIPWFNTSSAPDAKWLFFNWQLEVQKSTIIHQPKSNCGVYLEVYPNIPKSILMKAIPRHIQQTHSTVMSMCNSPPQLNHGFWRVFDIKGKQVFHPASYMQVYLQIYHPKTQELAGLLSKAQVPTSARDALARRSAVLPASRQHGQHRCPTSATSGDVLSGFGWPQRYLGGEFSI